MERDTQLRFRKSEMYRAFVKKVLPQGSPLFAAFGQIAGSLLFAAYDQIAVNNITIVRCFRPTSRITIVRCFLAE